MSSLIMSMRLFSAVLIFSTGVAACAAGRHSGDESREAEPRNKICIEKDAVQNGIFDASIEYDNEGIGWMAYSRVKLPKSVDTRIAKSADKGKTWQFVGIVNPSVDGHQEVVEGGQKSKRVKGVWRNETPSLLYDPQDEPARRWKLFYHHYLSRPPFKKGNSLFAQGWIEFRYAKSPAGPWSKPIRLFGSKQSKCLVDLNSLHEDLKENAFYNEIGTISVNGVIYLSVDSSTTRTGLGEWNKRRVVLFSSKDHGGKWEYAGTLTDHEDAGKFGYLIFTGSSLVREGKKLYLLITPAGKKGLFVKNRGHDGTYIIEFVDISKAKLKRNANGMLVVLKRLKPDPDMNSAGLSDYDEQNTRGGILLSQLSSNSKHRPEFFRVYSTGAGIK